MSAIGFVVRSSAGNVERGAVSGGAAGSIMAAPGAAVSLNLRADQIAAYTRSGDALQVTLVDGTIITVDGFYGANGEPQADLYVSSDGSLSRVTLLADGQGGMEGIYAQAEAFGKWSPEDDLFFLRGSDLAYADAAVIAPADGEAGMLATALLGGLGGIGPAVGLGGAALVGGALLVGGTKGDEDSGIELSVTGGTESTGDVVTGAEMNDNGGVVVTGKGDTGATVTVTTEGGTSETTTVDDNGDWTVTLDGDDVGEGEYNVDVTVTTDKDGETATIDDTVIVDTTTHVKFDATEVGDSGTVNGDGAAGDVLLTGTVEEGATVVVTVGGQDYDATVTGGEWSVTLPTGSVAGGEYDLSVSVTATDAVGNTASTSGVVHVDTVATVSLNAGTVNAGMVVSGTEHSDGAELAGTAQAGSTVVVEMNGAVRTVTAGEDGTWSAKFTQSELPSGEVTVPVSVTATDPAGNVASTSGSVDVDTLVNRLEILNDITNGDDILNGAEQSAQVVLNGAVEPGSTVTVVIKDAQGNDVAGQVSVDGQGNWTATWPAGALPEGEYDTNVEVTATDAAGNTASLSEAIRVDTLVDPLTSDSVTSDNLLNAAEAASGATLTGSVEPGSTVFVTHNGVRHEASVAADGSWSVQFAAGEIAGGEYDATAVIEATDAAGNTAQTTQSFSVDTTAPDAAVTLGVYDRGVDVEGMKVDATDGDYSVHQIDASGNVSEVAQTQVALGGKTVFDFSPAVPDGSDLIVTNTEDGSGNTNSTYFAQQSSATNVVDLDVTALSGFDIQAIDLDVADNAKLELTEADIRALSGTTNTLTITGGADDSVSLGGAVKTGETQSVTENGVARDLDVYTLGDASDAVTIMIDDDITVV